MIDMSVDFAGVKFKNPIIAASGTFGFGREYGEIYDISRLGGICVKGLTLKPRAGNSPPRIAETPMGILNSVGLQNPGAEVFVEKELPFLNKLDTRIIANINGGTIEEFSELAELLSGSTVDMLELNISCPNAKNHGMSFGNDPEIAAKVTAAVRSRCAKPLIVKLSPNVTDIAALAMAVEGEGADAVSLINTILGMRIDVTSRRPILKNNVGGLSGPAVLPVAIRMVWQVYNAVSIPIIGMGGISKGTDAAEMLLAGASLTAIGTASFVNPMALLNILDELNEFCATQGLKKVSELTGAVKPY